MSAVWSTSFVNFTISCRLSQRNAFCTYNEPSEFSLIIVASIFWTLPGGSGIPRSPIADDGRWRRMVNEAKRDDIIYITKCIVTFIDILTSFLFFLCSFATNICIFDGVLSYSWPYPNQNDLVSSFLEVWENKKSSGNMKKFSKSSTSVSDSI